MGQLRHGPPCQWKSVAMNPVANVESSCYWGRPLCEEALSVSEPSKLGISLLFFTIIPNIPLTGIRISTKRYKILFPSPLVPNVLEVHLFSNSWFSSHHSHWYCRCQHRHPHRDHIATKCTSSPTKDKMTARTNPVTRFFAFKPSLRFRSDKNIWRSSLIGIGIL